MNTLDNPMVPQESEVPFFQTALRYGLIGAGVAIAVSLISNLLGLAEGNQSMGMVIGCISILLYIGFQVMGVKTHREDELNGYISFGRAFITALVVGIVMGVVSSLFNYIYLTFIDPGMLERVMNMTYEAYEQQGMSEEQIEAAMSMVGGMMTAEGQLMTGLIGAAVISAITGLIIAAVMKRDAPLA